MSRVQAACFAACLLVSAAAAAQSPAASAAETLFREGKALAAQQRYEEAIEKFRASEDLEPSVGVLLSLGDAQKARGKVSSAWGAYVSARDLAKAKGDSRVTDAEQRIAEVLPRLPYLMIRVSMPQSVTVTEDGLVLPPASLGSKLPVDPGPHTVVATAPGYRTFRSTESFTEGEYREILVPLLHRDALVENDDSTRRTVGTGLVIGGGAATVLGLAFGAVAISNWTDVKDTCPNRVCANASDRDAVQGKANTANGLAIASTATIAVGLAVLAAGLVLRLTTPAKSVAFGTLGASFP